MGLWKQLQHQIAASLAWPLRQLFGPRDPQAFGILLYHRVVAPPVGVPEPTYSVSPDEFRAQLTGLLNLGYRPIALREAIHRHAQGEDLARRFVVTFDDCYGNVHTQAFPILRELEVPATLFLATAYLDQQAPFPFDDWSHAGSPEAPAETWLPITRQQCRAMQESGLIELAAHTHTHADFRGRAAALETDLRQCVAVLAAEFDVHEPTFAFPYGTTRLGYAGGELSAAARRCGVQCALSTDRGMIAADRDPFHWGRIECTPDDNASTIVQHFDGWLAFVRETYLRATFRATAAPPVYRPALRPAGGEESR